ncbi:MAG: S-methyl-5'-thioinosine phosphorylase [Candidatus Polarisedimenticolaceae bacterium]|nr:S-methyl-5'-thioinosine phosphorylase [Candidatus Polarisedimenticolaceae bacterium]
MTALAIIGGSGFTNLKMLEVVRREVVHTPYGEPSAPLTHGLLDGKEVTFLPRHGSGHIIPPHKVNYRANLWALKSAGIHRVIGVAAVGGIRKDMQPGMIAVPDQIIDYTYCRQHTLFEDDLQKVTHIDFTEPYSENVRQALLKAAKKSGVKAIDGGTYGATQGPRLETAMEVTRLQRDGCDLVGMTGMPEASLAREFDMEYASCSVIANWAAGINDGPITMEEIEANLVDGLKQVHKLLVALTKALD